MPGRKRHLLDPAAGTLGASPGVTLGEDWALIGERRRYDERVRAVLCRLYEEQKARGERLDHEAALRELARLEAQGPLPEAPCFRCADCGVGQGDRQVQVWQENGGPPRCRKCQRNARRRQRLLEAPPPVPLPEVRPEFVGATGDNGLLVCAACGSVQQQGRPWLDTDGVVFCPRCQPVRPARRHQRKKESKKVTEPTDAPIPTCPAAEAGDDGVRLLLQAAQEVEQGEVDHD